MRRALLLLGLLSCKVAYERYCVTSMDCPEDFPVCDEGRHLCGPRSSPDAAPPCTPTSCTGENHVCLDGTCVQCLDNNSGDCAPAKPVCENHVCRKCVADVECPELCDTELGTCVGGDEILHVSPTGSGTSCIAAAPCAKISDAVAAISSARHWIQVNEGNYADTVQINTAEAVHIVGVGSVLVIPSTNAPIIAVGSSANVLLRGLRLANGDDANNDGVRCDGGIGTLERSKIFGNQSGGLVLFQSGFTVRNNYIYGNGTDISSTGGVRFVLASASPAIFEFNTLAKNVATAGIGPGLHCDMALDINSVIVWGNGASPSVAQVGGNCSFDYSDIGGTAVEDKHNIKMDPMFTNPAADNYSLGATSPCIETGKPGTMTTDDFQGEPRPNGTAPDIGADEKY